MDVVQSVVNADNRSEVEKFTSCLDNWRQWSWTLSPGPLPRRLNYLPESDSGVSFHQLLTPDSKQKIITIEVCIYKSLSEKAMATHSNTLAWKIPWTEEPGRLQSMGLLRVGHDWVTSLSLHFHYQQSHNFNDYNGYLTIPLNRSSLQNRTPTEPAVE